MALTFQQLVTDPQFLLTVRQIGNALALQQRAIPAAAPELRQALETQANRHLRLADLADQIHLGRRQLAMLQDRQRFQRGQTRLENLVGLGALAVSGLGAFRDIRAADARQRTQQTLADLDRRLRDLMLAQARADQALAQQRLALFQLPTGQTGIGSLGK